jgi:hypothetical protein
MEEFTEKHHAFIAASFYDLLTKNFAERGEAAFVHATQRYAEQRGARMAQRAIRDGQPLTFETYRAYGEWVNTQSVKDEGCDNQGYVTSYSPDFVEHVTQCPWATQFKAMGMSKAGTVYCKHLDNSVVRGFNPYLVYEVPQSMHEHDFCIQIAKNANFKEGKIPTKNPKYLRTFDYHCGHIYKTFSVITIAIFGAKGQKIAAQVLQRFAETYGQDMADVLIKYYNEDFDVI